MNLKISNYTMQNAEELVCQCVSKVLLEDGRAPVDIVELYHGKTNIPLGRAIARNVVFDILHNKYGFSYSVISQRASMGLTSVMRCVRKSIQMRNTDVLYIRVYELVDKKLRKMYEEDR